ncbi:aminoglycoside phosphotransferase [Herbidospora sp. NEAU-GS84]|uniref:Maltokinase n=1 Tax=Herbidospora solisilvae TaxID=2696284 RepID=A0A7C9J4Z8_9ACTN|nr:aminoglycoside phosphotransferase [Herbidospora solisilvae]NAS24645.1 aminoglycoside phosphotransferase [Herbidospora solisilvae]
MLAELLTGWIADQRWFAGKGRPIDDLSIESTVPLMDGDPALAHLIVKVVQGDRTTRYQLLLGLRDGLSSRLRHVFIGRCEWDGRERDVYDAAHDAELMGRLLHGIARDATVGPLSFHRAPEAEIDTSQRSLVMTAEQSNTSIVFGDQYILKMFRVVIPGMNPELEIVRALADEGSHHVARPFGWVEGTIDGETTTLAIMQAFLGGASEGWAMALTSVRDLYATPREVSAGDAGGDFAAEAERLGVATAEVHREMREAFGYDALDPDEIHSMAELYLAQLERAVAEVPALADHADVAREAYDLLASIDEPVLVQRVHGDYHLGQVMRTYDDWIVLDFEGEPGQPLAERRALHSPLRDVAGMLRSFEYAARHLLADHPDAETLEDRAEEWAVRNRAAFLSGYTRSGGELRPADVVMMRALELAKAVYEVVYEARNRPSWLPIPLAAFTTKH